MQLSELFTGQPDVEIKGICIDSRKAREGDLFFCLKGLENDGHVFAEQACRGRAVAVVHSDPIERRDGVVYIQAEDTVCELNRVCDLFYGQPSRKLKMFGITGTNGKTTTASIISDVFSARMPCGYIGTIAVRFGTESRASNLTTPDAQELHSTLREMADAGMVAVAMEVSSHGLAMRRVDTVDFDVTVFTNLTYDHLDYHKTMERYFEAKKRLFKNLKSSGTAVLNADDVSFEGLRECLHCGYVTYGVNADADYRAENIRLSPDCTAFTLVHGGKRYAVESNLVALYNVYNLLGAAAAMHRMGMPLDEMLPFFSRLTPVDGRMESIARGQDFRVIVDYAHTPDGFEKVFQYAREIAKGGRIYAVFGCAGKRDRVKRGVLGKIADKYCDRIYVTEEDPRSEDAADIARAILSGIGEGKGMFVKERYAAIEAAINRAQTGDIVLILGKGNENYMCYAHGKEPWMGDHRAAERALENRRA